MCVRACNPCLRAIRAESVDSLPRFQNFLTPTVNSYANQQFLM